MFTIKLKEKANPSQMNLLLEMLGSNHTFNTPEMNQLWLDDVNTNPSSYQKHWKPEGRLLTMDELKSYAGMFGEESVLHCDTKYDRTPEEEMVRLAKFVVHNKHNIEYVKNTDDLIEKAKISQSEQELLMSLEKEEAPIEMLSEDEQYRPDLESGLLLCKSFSPNPFWVMFGNVETPKFLKEKIYKDDMHNRLYRDKQSLGYLLLPLYNFKKDFFEKVYTEAYKMGLREHYYYFAHMVYHLEVETLDTDLAVEFKEDYTVEERLERVKTTLSALNPSMSLKGNSFDSKIVRNRIVPSDKAMSIKLVNAFLLSLKDDYAKLIAYDYDGSKEQPNTLTFSNGETHTF